MAYEFKEHESVPEGVKRIAGHEIDTVLEALRQGGGNGHADSNGHAPKGRKGRGKEGPKEGGKGGGKEADLDAAVHDARKGLKRLRALVRLVRDEIGDKAYRRENRRYRDAARPLGDLRDARAMSDTVEKLAEHFKGQVRPLVFAPLGKALAKRRDEAMSKLDEAGGMAGLVKAVEKAARKVEEWAGGKAIAREDWGAVAGGLKRVYKRGLRAMEAALDAPTFENLHEWRKRVKDLWHALQLFTPAWPQVMEPLAEQAHDLSDCLGDDHDLSVLQRAIADDPGLLVGEADGKGPKKGEGHAAEALETVGGLIDARREQLQACARTLGGRLYAERPREFVARLEQYWYAWQAECNRLGERGKGRMTRRGCASAGDLAACGFADQGRSRA